jgi:hypothetical protein
MYAHAYIEHDAGPSHLQVFGMMFIIYIKR